MTMLPKRAGQSCATSLGRFSSALIICVPDSWPSDLEAYRPAVRDQSKGLDVCTNERTNDEVGAQVVALAPSAFRLKTGGERSPPKVKRLIFEPLRRGRATRDLAGGGERGGLPKLKATFSPLLKDAAPFIQTRAPANETAAPP